MGVRQPGAGRRVLAATLLLTSTLAAGFGLTPSLTPARAASAPGLRVLASEPGEILVELTVGDYALEPVSAGGERYVRLTLPDTQLTNAPGAPQVPVRAALLGVPTLAGLSVSVVASEAEALEGLRLYPAPALVAAPESAFESDLPAAPPVEVYAPDAAIYNADQNYPGQPVELGESGLLRDQAVAQVRFYPVQYNPVTGAATLYRRLVARLTWDAGQVSAAVARPESAAVQAFIAQSLLNGNDLPPASAQVDAAAPSLIETGTFTPSLKISLTSTGLYRLTYAQLTAAGFNVASMDPRQLTLTHGGAEVPIRVVGESDGVFGAADYVLFYGTRYEDVYTNVNVYWLEQGGVNGLRMAAQDGAPGGASVPAHFPVRVHAEVNQNYWQNMPNGTGQEHWFWGTLLSPNTGGLATFRDYSDSMGYPPAGCGCLTLNNLSTTAPTATVTVRLRGYTTPSHQTRLAVNGSAVVTTTWAGQIQFGQTAVFSHTQLVNGNNVIRVETLSVPSSPDQILVDWIELDYWDRYVAENNALTFGTPAAGAQRFQVTGFTTNTMQVFDVTNPAAPSFITHTVLSGAGTYTATFQATVTAGVQYLAAAPTQFKTPAGMALDQPSQWRSAGNAADWIIITHESFLTSAQTLASFRAGQGLRTAVVKVQDVYDEFNAGLFNPQAIKDFLDYAYDHWQAPAPAYVVLLGDACQDYKNARWDTSLACARNYVPSQLYEAAVYGQVPSDHWFTTFQGDDQLPDMFIGRLSAQTAGQAAAIVSKLIVYETTPPAAAWSNNVLLVADDVDVTFETISDDVADTVPAGYDLTRVYAADYPPGTPPTSISSQINAGSLLVSYFGHGAVERWGLWSGGEIFNTGHVNSLSNAGKYTVVTIGNCLNGLFSGSDGAPAMAETWQRAASKGAVAVWAPTNVGFPSSHRLLMLAFYTALFDDELYHLGAATTQAALDLLALNSGFGELVATYVLFGDPATRIGVQPLPTAWELFLPLVAR